MAGGFRRLPLLIYSLLEENTEENMETSENNMRLDDLLIFMMLGEHKKLKMLQFELIPTQREQFHGCPIPLFVSTLGYQDQQPKRLTNFWETAWRSQYQEKEVDLLLTLKTASHNVVVSWQS